MKCNDFTEVWEETETQMVANFCQLDIQVCEKKLSVSLQET